MPDANPLEGEDPYDVLGVTEEDRLEKIENRKDNLFNKWNSKESKAKLEDDNDLFIKSTKAMKNINEAWDWIEENHDPPAADHPVSIDVVTDSPKVGSPVTVKVTSEGSPVAETLVKHDKSGEDSDTTGSDGEAEFIFSKYGRVQFTVPTTKPYEDATESAKISRKESKLSFDGLPDKVEVNHETEFVVLGDDGPEEDVTIRLEDTDIGKTDSDGSVAHAFSDVGTHTVEAVKPKDDVASYLGCKTEVDVTEEMVDLEVYVEGSDYEVSEEITVHVNEAKGDPVPDAEVSTGDSSRMTGSKGEAKLKLENGGSVTVRAEKHAPDEDRNYRPTETDIEVSKRKGNLRISSVDGKRMENSTLTVCVVDDGRLEDATVETNWGHEKNTDSKGEVKIVLDSSGRLEIEASKETEEVNHGSDRRVLEIDEFTRELRIDSITPEIPSPGDSITVKVTDGSGSGVSDATVKSTDRLGEEWKTDKEGEVEFTVSDLGVHSIIAQKDGGDFNGAKDEKRIRVMS